LHQVSAVVMSCEHAGHCPAGFATRSDAPAFGRSEPPPRDADRCGAARLTGAGRAGAPGIRRWQNGQCSGPASKLLRQRPHVTLDTAPR